MPNKILLLYRLLPIIVLIFGSFEASGQVKIITVEPVPGRNISLEKSYASRELAIEHLQKIHNDLQLQGYLESKMDTSFDGTDYHLSLDPGPRYQWDFHLAENSPVREDRNYNRDLNKAGGFGVVDEQIKSWLAGYENQGYPFCTVTFDSVKVSEKKVSGKLRVDPGPLILLDSLVIKSPQKLSKHYIRNYIGFRKENVYSEAWFRGLTTRLSEIPFTRQIREPEIIFKPGKAIVYLYLEKKKANYFNGVLGVQPNDQTGKVNITGDLEMKLVNAFNEGEDIYFNWRKLQNKTQDLNVKLTIPYLFNLPLGAGGSLKLYRRDSTFSSMNSTFSLIHLFTGTDYIKAQVESARSSTISNFQSANSLANVRAVLYGIGIKREKLDYRYNPRAGVGIWWEGGAGKKTIFGDVISEEPDRSLSQYKFEGIVDVYVPTFNRQTVHLAMHGGGVISDEVYDNEMFRIGGLRTLRGVDEESVYASSYAVFSVEYRLLLEKNSNIYLFMDQAWYEQKSPTAFVTDTPLGVGAGVNFDTGAGIFSLNYALGSQFDNPMQFRSAKISFGFRNLF